MIRTWSVLAVAGLFAVVFAVPLVAGEGFSFPYRQRDAPPDPAEAGAGRRAATRR